MLDRKYIVQNLELVRQNCEIRKVSVDLDEFVNLDEQWRRLTADSEAVNQESNANAKAMSGTKGKPDPEVIEAGRALKTRKAEIEGELREVEEALLDLQMAIPNMTDPHSPVGDDDSANEEIERGATEIREFGFDVKDHVELGEALDIFDFESGSKVAGPGFYYLRNDAVLLELAMQQYALRVLIEEGFTPVTTPDLARTSVLAGTGFNPRGTETNIYKVEDTDLNLIATSEITLAGIHADSIMDAKDLPLLLCGLSHCFRTERAAGRATRGLYRVHQFSKVEMFVFCLPEQSEDLHFRLRAIEQRIFDDLGIPYRVVENATGDLGNMAYRKFDIEAWMPGKGDGGSFGEVTSASNCTDYQARRLNIRYRDPETGKVGGFIHTLNGTAISLARGIISVVENHQQADGSITIPEALRPYMGKDAIVAQAARV